MGVEQAVLEKLRTLPIVQQQQVLDFVDFLQTKFLAITLSSPAEPARSALEVAGDLVGCIKGGSPDLSTNKRYME
jgi:hypothetical protein